MSEGKSSFTYQKMSLLYEYFIITQPMFQAYRYLREEVKTFRGKPIMVRDLITVHIVILLALSDYCDIIY